VDDAAWTRIRRAKQKLERTYTTSTVMHFALEPVIALRSKRTGVFRNPYGQSWQSLILPVLARRWPAVRTKSYFAPTCSVVDSAGA